MAPTPTQTVWTFVITYFPGAITPCHFTLTLAIVLPKLALAGCRQCYCGSKIISYPASHLKLITQQKKGKRKLSWKCTVWLTCMICGGVYVNQRCVCGCSFFLGKVDYMKKGATNKQKLKELRLTEQRWRWSCRAASPPCREAGSS